MLLLEGMFVKIFSLEKLFSPYYSSIFCFLSVLGTVIMQLSERIACEIDVWVLVGEVSLFKIPLMKNTVVKLFLEDLVHFFNNFVLYYWYTAVAILDPRRAATLGAESPVIAFEEAP